MPIFGVERRKSGPPAKTPSKTVKPFFLNEYFESKTMSFVLGLEQQGKQSRMDARKMTETPRSFKK